MQSSRGNISGRFTFSGVSYSIDTVPGLAGTQVPELSGIQLAFDDSETSDGRILCLLVILDDADEDAESVS
jgi:hypothetical protein